MSPNLTPMSNEINPKTLMWDCCHIHEWTTETIQNEVFVWLYCSACSLYQNSRSWGTKCWQSVVCESIY